MSETNNNKNSYVLYAPHDVIFTYMCTENMLNSSKWDKGSKKIKQSRGCVRWSKPLFLILDTSIEPMVYVTTSHNIQHSYRYRDKMAQC